MKPRQQVSRAAIELIKRFEGYRRSAAQLADGRWTIGYGHTKTARKGAEVSEADAEALLIYDLMEVAGVLNDVVYTPLTQNQFDALAAFVFNIGAGNFKHSGVLRRLNEGALLQAACAMEMWRKSEFDGERIVVDALVRRRAAEKALFLTPPQGFIPAPSPVIRPAVDQDVGGQVPSQRPVEVTTSMEGERAIAERIGALPGLEPDKGGVPGAPTVSEVAAEAITARLQSILSEPVEAAPEAPAPGELEVPWAPESADAIPETAPAPEVAAIAEASAGGAFTLTPPAPEAELRAEAHVTDFGRAQPELSRAAEPQLFEREPAPFEGLAESDAGSERFDQVTDFDEIPVEQARGLGPVPRLIALLLVGAVVFSGALFWAFNTHRQGEGLVSPPLLIGVGLGFVGIGCVATAVYFLLERLGGREEQ